MTERTGGNTPREREARRLDPSRVPATQVRLRPLRLDDAAELARLEHRNRRHLLSGAPRRGDDWATPPGQRAAIARMLAQHDAGTCAPFVILLDDDPDAPGRLVGRITLQQIVRGPAQCASVGYWIDEAESGRGVVTHALRKLVAVAFEGLGLHRLEASTAVGNEASVAVLRASGFQEIGYAPSMLRLGIAGEGWADCRLFQLVDSRTGDGTGGSAGATSMSDDGTSSTDADWPRIRAEVPGLAEALALYRAVGWNAYTEDPQTLGRALAGSTRVVTARERGRLVGLARVISDGASIAYLQDVLVDPDCRRAGIGRELVREAFAPFAAVRQHVLLTDADPGQRAFYEALGLTEAHDVRPPLHAFLRLRP
ncbi:GNAT family N-acetyltransferase [Brachybacterium sp. NPDC056505]|uniref:GNAT family N-acetyltransferase n=1 Tax=Brachybacterium sp. NPDC056505 TaxID=3345843 RepID=UPI00366C9C16